MALRLLVHQIRYFVAAERAIVKSVRVETSAHDRFEHSLGRDSEVDQWAGLGLELEPELVVLQQQTRFVIGARQPGDELPHRDVLECPNTLVRCWSSRINSVHYRHKIFHRTIRIIETGAHSPEDLISREPHVNHIINCALEILS